MIFPLEIRLVKTGRLVDLIGLVDLGLVDWGNSWGIDWRLAQEVRRRGELVRLLGFWLLHAWLKYNSLWNYGPTIGMIHERQKQYRLSYTIVKVEWRTKEWRYGPSEPCS